MAGSATGWIGGSRRSGGSFLLFALQADAQQAGKAGVGIGEEIGPDPTCAIGGRKVQCARQFRRRPEGGMGQAERQHDPYASCAGPLQSHHSASSQDPGRGRLPHVPAAPVSTPLDYRYASEWTVSISTLTNFDLTIMIAR